MLTSVTEQDLEVKEGREKGRKAREKKEGEEDKKMEGKEREGRREAKRREGSYGREEGIGGNVRWE